MGRVRLVATDLDGTLLRSDHTISPRTLNALAKAHEAGITVVPATGRGWRSAEPLLQDVPDLDLAVCSNGSVVRSLRRGEDLHLSPLAAAAYAETVQRLHEVVPDAGFFWERISAREFDERYAGLRPHVHRGERPTVRSIPAEADDVLKVLVCHPDHAEPELLALLEAVLPSSVTVSFSGGDLVEITGAGVDKSFALGWVCERLGIDSSEVVAIGDNRNDVEMLRWAGIGIAMAGATVDAIEAADERTAGNDDDGVALVLESLLG